MVDTWTNQLYLGDNLTILSEYIPDESVDLIYLIPLSSQTPPIMSCFLNVVVSSLPHKSQRLRIPGTGDKNRPKLIIELSTMAPAKLLS